MKLGSAIVAVLIAGLVGAAQAGAAVTVGSPPTGASAAGNLGNCTLSQCSLINRVLPAGQNVTSPIDGVIVRWSFRQGPQVAAGPVTLRVVHPSNGSPPNLWAGVATGPSVQMGTAAATMLVDTRVPISAGDGIGLDVLDNHAAFDTVSAPSNVAVLYGWLGNGTLPRGSDNIVSGLMQNAVDVEADADHDGFGDETQDACPADPALHTAPCTTPAATVTPPPAKRKCHRKKRTKGAEQAKKRRCKHRKRS
jgi:hypothetical protein